MKAKIFSLLLATLIFLASGNKVLAKEMSFEETQQFLKNLKSVTYRTHGVSWKNFDIEKFEKDVREIREAGFNAVWLICPWINFEPDTNTDVFLDASFENLNKALSILEENGLWAVLGLNYLGYGWSPEGIDRGKWLVDDAMWSEFLEFSKEMAKRTNTHPNIIFLVFTENSEPEEEHAPPGQDYWQWFTSLLQQRYGPLPDILKDLRNENSLFGYHDYTVVAQWKGNGRSPIPSENSYNFVSTNLYPGSKNASDWINEFNLRASRFKQVVPDRPLWLGEIGYSLSLAGDENTQADVLEAALKYITSQGFGFNFWMWQDINSSNIYENTLGILRLDGSRKPIYDKLLPFLQMAPVIGKAGYSPAWPAVWLKGDNLKMEAKATVYDQNQSLIEENIPTKFDWSSTLTFGVPLKTLSMKQIFVQIINPSGIPTALSNRFSLSIPHDSLLKYLQNFFSSFFSNNNQLDLNADGFVNGVDFAKIKKGVL